MDAWLVVLLLAWSVIGSIIATAMSIETLMMRLDECDWTGRLLLIPLWLWFFALWPVVLIGSAFYWLFDKE